MSAERVSAGAEPARHVFQPYVDVFLNADGSYRVELDWSDAYLGAADGDGDHDNRHPEGAGAEDAVRGAARAGLLPTALTIPPVGKAAR